MNCVVCTRSPVESGLLCEDCREEIAGPLGLVPEQILATSAKPTGAVMIDSWGRPHAVDARTLLGRQLEGAGVSIIESSVSRHHAHLGYEPTHKQWALRDLGSANGTMVNEQVITDAVNLRAGDRVTLGQVGFYFVPDGRDFPPVVIDPAISSTLRPSDRMRAPVSENEFERESTDVGLPFLDLRLHEPTGGGGGLVEAENRQVQLTATQFEFFDLLVKRMIEEAHQPHLVRGFVRTSELIGDLSWDTRDPGDNHVKQLVRRVRRALIKAEVGDLIESRHRFGYRLRVIPRAK
jgi:FHA domain